MIAGFDIKNVLVTGGSGFIGSHFLSYSCKHFPNIQFTNIDNLSYAVSKKTQSHLQKYLNYDFKIINITDLEQLQAIFNQKNFDLIVHFAAESHVDNSIESPFEFINSNIIGTYNLLQCLNSNSIIGNKPLFHHISTDEIFGSLKHSDPAFTEESNFAPSSPYSASKASSDMLVEAWGKTFGINYLITNCSNNFGPRQYLEKLIPKVILNRVQNKKIPIYGNGENIRDWLYVSDHIDAIIALYGKGLFINQRFNIGGGHEVSNLELTQSILSIMDQFHGYKDSFSFIEFVEDRKGHDFRYAIDSSKIRREAEWSPKASFETYLKETVEWYLEHSDWWSN